MKVWFFYEEFKGSKGHWHKGYDAMIDAGGHMTCGSTLAEAIYMAHDLIAGVISDDDDMDLEYIGDYKAQAADLEIPESSYVGFMDIDVDLLGGGSWVRKSDDGWIKTGSGWARKGDSKPKTRQPFRLRTLEKAFEMVYRNFQLKK